MASTDSRPIPIKNTAYRAVFSIRNTDGDLVTGAAGLDSEVSKDQGAFTDCTNEATEIATSSGVYYLDLTSTEMNADCVTVIVKSSTSGAKTTVLVFYPEETGDINVDVTAINGSAAAAVRQALAAGVISVGTVDNTAFTATSTILESDDITEATADHFIGRSIYFTSGALVGAGPVTVIDYALTSGRGRFTYSATPTAEAPADNVTFIVV